jgi:succinate dehydrogenase flavin-adding protein (antitoxin of CptAB toxin-antitoxin module)
MHDHGHEDARAGHTSRRGLADYDPVLLAHCEDALTRLTRRERQVFIAIWKNARDPVAMSSIRQRLRSDADGEIARALASFALNLRNPRRRCWRRWLAAAVAYLRS